MSELNPRSATAATVFEVERRADGLVRELRKNRAAGATRNVDLVKIGFSSASIRLGSMI